MTKIDNSDFIRRFQFVPPSNPMGRGVTLENILPGDESGGSSVAGPFQGPGTIMIKQPDSNTTGPAESTASSFVKGALGAALVNLILWLLKKNTKSIEDAYQWLLSMLALGYEESKLNPTAQNTTMVKYEGKLVPASVYGLFQHTRGNWADNAIAFGESIFGKLPQAFKDMFSNNGWDVETMKQPINEWKNSGMAYVQAGVAATHAVGVIKRVNEYFVYRGGTWTVRSTHKRAETIETSQPYIDFTKAYGYLLPDYYMGRTALATMISSNGAGFYRRSKLYEHQLIKRVVESYNVMSNDPALKLDINEAVDTFEATFANPLQAGDVMSDLNIISPFGPRIIQGVHDFHKGIDIAYPVGTEILAPADGWVSEKFYHVKGGNTLRLRHSDGSITGYAHLLSLPVFAVGEYIPKGTVIAKIGLTGVTHGPHLHFSYRRAKGADFMDPMIQAPDYVANLFQSRTVYKDS